MNPKCKNMNCQQLIADFDVKKMAETKRPFMSRNNYCIKCRIKLGKFKSLFVLCGGCKIPLEVQSFAESKCSECVKETTRIRNIKRNKNPTKTSSKIIKLLGIKATTKNHIKETLGLSEHTFKYHMARARKQVQITSVLSYKITPERVESRESVTIA